MPQTEVWTIGRLLEWTTGYLKDHGADSPRLDAEVLLAEALGCRRIELYTRFDELPDQSGRSAFRELVRRRAEGNSNRSCGGTKAAHNGLQLRQ